MRNAFQLILIITKLLLKFIFAIKDESEKQLQEKRKLQVSQRICWVVGCVGQF